VGSANGKNTIPGGGKVIACGREIKTAQLGIRKVSNKKEARVHLSVIGQREKGGRIVRKKNLAWSTGGGKRLSKGHAVDLCTGGNCQSRSTKKGGPKTYIGGKNGTRGERIRESQERGRRCKCLGQTHFFAGKMQGLLGTC